MKGEPHHDGTVDAVDLWRVLQDLEDGSLEPGERDGLMELLERSPAARAVYLEYFEQAAILTAEAATHAEQGILPVLEEPRRFRKSFRRSVLAAAAVLALSALIAALIAIKQPKPGILTAEVAAETQWAVDGKMQDPNSDALTVVEGSAVRVFSGTVKLQLESGALMVLQGPALAAFPKPEHPVLKQGWLWIDSGAAEDPLEVETPGVLVRDVGTRFGVRVTEEGATEIHLVDGVVELISNHTREQLAVLKPDGEGVLIPPAGERTALPLARDPFPGLPDLLGAQPNYRTTVLSQAPVGYWRLNEQALGEAANELPEGSVGRHALEAMVGEPGVGAADGFHGFGEDNYSVSLAAGSEKSLIYMLDSPGGVSMKEGAVGFWARRVPGREKEEILWLAGESASEESVPEDSMYAYLTDSGRIQFFMENGKFDVLVSSTRSVVDGHWHHIVASWGPSAVDLYVDGKRVARDDDFRVLQEGVFSGKYVRFGKPVTRSNRRRAGPFTGWVDEIALWNRPLTPAEVHHQFRSARGTAPAPE